MKKVFILENLDCANCAAKMERAISELDGVINVSVSFITLKMILETEDAKTDEIIKKAKKIIKRQDPDVEMKEQ